MLVPGERSSSLQCGIDYRLQAGRGGSGYHRCPWSGTLRFSINLPAAQMKTSLTSFFEAENTRWFNRFKHWHCMQSADINDNKVGLFSLLNRTEHMFSAQGVGAIQRCHMERLARRNGGRVAADGFVDGGGQTHGQPHIHVVAADCAIGAKRHIDALVQHPGGPGRSQMPVLNSTRGYERHGCRLAEISSISSSSTCTQWASTDLGDKASRLLRWRITRWFDNARRWFVARLWSRPRGLKRSPLLWRAMSSAMAMFSGSRRCRCRARMVPTNNWSLPPNRLEHLARSGRPLIRADTIHAPVIKEKSLPSPGECLHRFAASNVWSGFQ